MLNIIIPTYNAIETLPKALDSLIAQTSNKFFVTVVQDCDGKDYSRIIKKYKDFGLKINLISTKSNGGPGIARQTGLDANKMCDYVMFMDADDMLLPNAVEYLYHAAKANNADVVKSGILAEVQDGLIANYEPHNTPCQWHHGKIYRAQYIRDIGLRFIDSLRYCEDSYFNVVACNATENIYSLPYDTYLWRNNNQSITRKKDSEYNTDEKGMIGYMHSQVEGVKKLLEIQENLGRKISIGLIACTVCNIYSAHMKIIGSGYNADEYYNDFLQLKNNDFFIEMLKSEEFWDTIEQHLKCCETYNDNLIFYSIKFNDWMKEILDKVYED